jgi:hypothetical protein
VVKERLWSWKENVVVGQNASMCCNLCMVGRAMTEGGRICLESRAARDYRACDPPTSYLPPLQVKVGMNQEDEGLISLIYFILYLPHLSNNPSFLN